MAKDIRRTVNILLIEGSPVHAALLEDLLMHSEPGSFHLTVATSLAAARTAIMKCDDDFDIVLVDLELSDSRGLMTLHCLQEVAPHLPIVVVMGIDDQGLALEAVHQGAQDFLVKGAFNDILLSRTIRYAIERHHAQEQLRDEKLRAEESSRNAAQLCAQLEAANAELKRLDTIKGNFLSTVSHELRTPLTIIKGALSNLADGIVGELSEQQQRIVDISHRNIDRLGRLIGDLLDLSRLESGRTVVHPRKMEADVLIRDAVQQFQASALEGNIALFVELPEEMPSLYADPDMMVQVINNLLSNALRYAKKHVVVRGAIEDDGFVLTVIDDGVGIAESEHGRLFNKFEQVNRPAGGAGYKGTGLGLAICKEILSHHNGEIWVESAPDRGAKFHCRFPCYDELAIMHATIADGVAKAQRENIPLCVLNLKITNMTELKQQHAPEALRDMMMSMKEHMLEKGLRQEDRVTACVERGTFIIEAQVARDGGVALKERLLSIMQKHMLATAREHIRPKLAIGMAMCPDDGLEADALLNKTLSNLQQPKVLVIDDEQAVLDMLAMLLQTTDFDVELANDGKEGIEKVYSYDPDVIVLDVIMPEMDGWEVCRRLRADERTKNKPIYMLTASTGKDLEERAAKYGAQLMHKPYDNKQIISLLRDAAIH